MFRALILVALAFLSLTNIRAQTFEVCPTCEYTTITSAIAAATPGSTIAVKAGVYKEGNIIIDKPLTLEGTDFPIIDGEHNTEIITIFADSVTIRGFQIQNVGTSYIKDRSGIAIERKDYIVIENNRLYDTFFGIYLKYVNHAIVRNNEIIGKAEFEAASGNAIQAWYSKNLTIENNQVSHHRDGIYFEFVDSSRVENNRSFENLRYGLHFMYSNHDSYDNNEFIENGAGVAVMFSRWIAMRNNKFLRNWGHSAYGLLLKEIWDAEIFGNIFEENTVAIYAEGSNRVKFKNNDFIRNGWAIRMSGSCEDNDIFANNFLGNTFDLTSNSNNNYNRYYENYWSEYAGYDLNHDGFGDVPYRPVKLFSFVISRTPTSIVLLRSLFIDMINFAEKVTPVFTPELLVDEQPLMKKIVR